MKRAKLRRWVRRIMVGVALVALAVPACAWLALKHIPEWYKPLQVPDDQLQRVRDGVTDQFRLISDQMVQHSTFEVGVTDQQVTEWAVARGAIWPDAESWLPDWVRDPVVVFMPGRVVAAAHVDYRGWEAIAGAHFSAQVEGDEVVLKLERVTFGALPIPLSTLVDPLDRFINAQRLDVEAMPDELAEGIRRIRSSTGLYFLTYGERFSGPFIWRNGDRPYDVRDIQIGDGWLKVTVEPL